MIRTLNQNGNDSIIKSLDSKYQRIFWDLYSISAVCCAVHIKCHYELNLSHGPEFDTYALNDHFEELCQRKCLNSKMFFFLLSFQTNKLFYF